MGYSKKGGELCPLPTPSTTPEPSETTTPEPSETTTPSTCSECNGKVTQLTLQYNGTSTAQIRVVEKDGKEVFNDTVQPGGQFTFSGQDKHGTLGTEIKIYVDGTLNTRIHTSCSKSIGPGLVSGDFEVVMGYSKNGGKLCPLPTPSTTPEPSETVTPEPSETPECDDCKGGVTDLTMRYNGNMENAHIEVTLKDSGDKVFDDTVQPGEEFSFEAPNGTTLKDIIIKVTAQTEIKADCDNPIGPGLVSGDFEVTGGHSKDGGLLCSIDNGNDGNQGGDDEHKGHDEDLTLSKAFGNRALDNVWASWLQSDLFQTLKQTLLVPHTSFGKIAVLE